MEVVEVRGKYEPLTELLNAASARGQRTVDLDFDAIASAVGGLPASAVVRQWWANSSHGQALAWRAAGFHVDFVSVDHRRVRFAVGERGGTYADRGRVAAVSSFSVDPVRVERAVVGEVDVRVRFQWLGAGAVTLDGAGKPTFTMLESVPGLYRLTFAGGASGGRPRVYIGESDNLHRRLAGNYRNPGPSRQTSLRINVRLREHLTGGGAVAVAVATKATVLVGAIEQSLDLSRKASRLLAENAALVLARVTGESDIENLD